MVRNSTTRSSTHHHEEEQPPMRAVAVMSSMAPSIQQSTTINSNYHKITPSTRLGKLPQLEPLKASARHRSTSSRSESIGVKNEWGGTVAMWEEDVETGGLPPVPVEFPLERTRREITGVDTITIAGRVAKVLQRLSVQTEYASKPPRAKCSTEDCVTFRIRLFAGEEDNYDNNDNEDEEIGQATVIVEVQRRSGSVVSFMRTCRAILDAVEGKPMDDVTRRATTDPFSKPVSTLECLQDALRATDSDLVATAKEALEGAIAMVRSKSRETRLMGLEKLVSLTDPVKTGPVVAQYISRSILLSSEGHDCQDCREEIQALMERDVFGDTDSAPSDHEVHVRYLALWVFANAFAMCAKDGSLARAVDNHSWFVNFLMPSLMGELSRAETCTNNAYQAASCLQSLISCTPKAAVVLVNDNGKATIESAWEVGKVRHALLADEAQRCLEELSRI